MSRHHRAPDPNDPGTWNTPDPVATPAPAPDPGTWCGPDPVAQPDAGFDPWSWLMPEPTSTRPHAEPDPTDIGTWNTPPSAGFPMDLLSAFAFAL